MSQTAVTVRSPLLLFARYHGWANRTLAAGVPFELAAKPAPFIHFGSIHATVNHIVGAEKLWLDRLRIGGTTELHYLWSDECPPEKWVDVEPDFKAALAALIRGADEVAAYVESLSEADLVAKATYNDTKGVPSSAQRGAALMHVLNHATHHRSQVLTALHAFGAKAPALDMSYMGSPGFRL